MTTRSICKQLSTLLLLMVTCMVFMGGHVLALRATPAFGDSRSLAQTVAVPPGYQIQLNGVLPDPSTGPDQNKNIYSIVFAVTGALSLLMVTVGGFRYVASQGDPQAAARAKGTITYALIGLLVSVSAVAIVTFVVGRT
jgi:hypothetical protein